VLPTLVAMSLEDNSNAGASLSSRSLFSKLNGMYAVAKTYVPSVANSSLQRIENGVSNLIERNVTPELVTSLESRLDNILTAHADKIKKVTDFAHKVGERATPAVKSVEGKINSTIKVVRHSKKRFGDLVENVKQIPQNLQDRATAIALDSIQRVDDAIDCILPEDANATDDTKKECKVDEKDVNVADDAKKECKVDEKDVDATDDAEKECKVDEDKPSENDQEELLQRPDEIEEIVQRSIAISSKKLLGKVSKRIQKKIWKRVASAQGFAKRQGQVIHTNLLAYASTVLDHTVPDSVRAMYGAVLEFPDSAVQVYSELKDGDIVDAPEFRAALQQKMGDAWVQAMGPAAEIYCKVVNGILQAKTFASQTREEAASQIQNLFELAMDASHTSYTVATGHAAIVFNKVVPQTVRQAASAYLERVEEATDLVPDDSFLRNYSSKIATIVSLAQNDLQETCVRLYDPIKSMWESRANFDFGRSLLSLLTKVPTSSFSQIYGFFQGLLSVDQIQKMRDFAGKAMATAQSRVKRVVNAVAPVAAVQNHAEHVCNDEDTSMVIPLVAMAERVYANLRKTGSTVDFRSFLSEMRTQVEVASEEEWKGTLLNATRRMFSQLSADDILEDEDEAKEPSAGDILEDEDKAKEPSADDILQDEDKAKEPEVEVEVEVVEIPSTDEDDEGQQAGETERMKYETSKNDPQEEKADVGTMTDCE